MACKKLQADVNCFYFWPIDFLHSNPAPVRKSYDMSVLILEKMKNSGFSTPAASFIVTTVAMMTLVSTSVQAEAVYRLQEGAEVIYQDRAPSSLQDNGHSILNKQGVVLRQVLSREERRVARKRAEEVRLSKIRDRALLATFTTEEDLIRTRDDRMGMIDGLISRLDDRILILSERLTVLETRIDNFEQAKGEGNAPESLYVEKQSIQRNIENAWTLIDSKAVERKTLVDKFDDDLQRYRELRAERSN